MIGVLVSFPIPLPVTKPLASLPQDQHKVFLFCPSFRMMANTPHCSWPRVWPLLPEPWNPSRNEGSSKPNFLFRLQTHTGSRTSSHGVRKQHKIHKPGPLTCQQQANKSSLVALGGRNTLRSLLLYLGDKEASKPQKCNLDSL